MQNEIYDFLKENVNKTREEVLEEIKEFFEQQFSDYACSHNFKEIVLFLCH